MTRINLDRLPEEERIGRKALREAIIAPSGEENPDIYTKRAVAYEFKLKKPALDAQGHIDAFYFEEGMRQQYYYPFIKPGSIVFDIGACHGSWTMPALALGARVYAWEPDPRWCNSLLDSVSINPGFKDRFQLFSSAVSDENYRNVTMDELEEVQCMKLDDFVKHYEVYPDFIKIDTEGMEGRIIQGALETLSRDQKPRLLVEHHPQVAPQAENWIIETLQKTGYWFTPLRQKTDWVSWSFWEPSDVPYEVLRQAYNE